MLVINYVSRWVEAIATKTNESKVVVDFMKFNIFYRFGVPKALTESCLSYSTSMGWCIELPQPTTPRQVAKLKYSIGKSRKHCKRWSIPAGRAGANSLRMLYVNNGSSSYKNWTNSAWKPMRTPGSISRRSSKLCSKWDGPFVIINVFPYGEVELKDENTNGTFQVLFKWEGTLGDIARVVYLKRVEKEKEEKLQVESKKRKAAKIAMLQQK
ncbi:hypothetical protein CR513_42473, partial [Mucuna pruriens]